MSGERRTRIISVWLLLNFIPVPFVRADDVLFCIKKTTYHNVVLRGGLEAGKYMPWEPPDESHMTVDRCTEHCCKSPDTDVVFLLNSYCFCVKCHSLESCSLVKITPPSQYTPITVTVLKRISKLSTPTKSFSHTRIFSRTQSTELSTQPSTIKPEQKETKGKERTDHVTTKPTEATTDDGFGRGNGTEIANLEMKNPHLPSINGYIKTKDGPKSEAITSYNGISTSSVITTANIGVNFTTSNVTLTGPTTPRPTRVVTTEKKAEGTGNDDISLQCPGTLKVTRVRAFGIPGDNKTVDDFDKHCQANLGQVDGTNVCIVSLKRVYKTSYPPFIKTLVTYTCSYTEHVS
ncbi:uncharacterized protein LOC144646151 isoform X1 [Oculina patagonica]